MSPETIIYREKLHPAIKDAYNHVKNHFDLGYNKIILISGASLYPFLDPKNRRTITDVDFIISPNNSSPQPNIKIDTRSVPWGMVFINPLTTLELINGVQIDVLDQMVHLHLNEPMRGFLYRLNFNDFLQNSTEINGIRVARPEITILYKLMNWRNGTYPGWDREKRDIKDIQDLLNGIVSYQSVIETIINLVPDPKVAEVLVERLNRTLTKDPPNMTDTSKLASQRQWGQPELPPDIREKIENFLTKGGRCTWLQLPESLTI